jgi:hypothetical protein
MPSFNKRWHFLSPVVVQQARHCPPVRHLSFTLSFAFFSFLFSLVLLLLFLYFRKVTRILLVCFATETIFFLFCSSYSTIS